MLNLKKYPYRFLSKALSSAPHLFGSVHFVVSFFALKLPGYCIQLESILSPTLDAFFLFWIWSSVNALILDYLEIHGVHHNFGIFDDFIFCFEYFIQIFR